MNSKWTACIAFMHSVLGYGAMALCGNCPIVEAESDLSESNTAPPTSSQVTISITQDIIDASPPCSRIRNSPAFNVDDVIYDFSLSTEWWRGWCQPDLQGTSYSVTG